MTKTCLKCGRVNAAAGDDELACCPGCGAIYSRVDAAMQRERQQAQSAASARKGKSINHEVAAAARVRRNNIVAVLLVGAVFFVMAISGGDEAPAEGSKRAQPAVSSAPAAPRPEVAKPAVVECGADDSMCIGKRELASAAGPCRRAVEQQLAYRHEWTDAWYEDKFDRVGWYVPTSTIIYHGSKLEAQNGFGAWKKVSYFCVWNVAGGRVVKAGVNG